jgi:hypothetical protein
VTLEETLARAIAGAFWETAEQPRPWDAHSPMHKQVWMNCARAAVEAGKKFREERKVHG